MSAELTAKAESLDARIKELQAMPKTDDVKIAIERKQKQLAELRDAIKPKRE